MAPRSFLLLLPLLLAASASAQSAPGPAPAGPINVTAILEKAGQYTRFIHFLNITQAGDQLNNQVNNSHDGMTLFAPTDNAFQNLPPGALNDLTPQQQVQLVQNHICPKFYSLTDLLSVSNPVRTLTFGQPGGDFGLNFTGQNNQVNVSTGAVVAPVYNALRKDFPLAVYQVDKVLLPRFFDAAEAPSKAPAADGSKSGGGAADGATAPSTSNPAGSGAARVGVGMAIWLVCMGLVSS
ncbi:fasciclin-like arabinogalactan protein 9 [Salvia miltiorrhiza]|uniref:fasciclin-like arabinogalactan protein 9 n=1 Tax=Salvia miltiorrhiza TaxID=226208 RepID=UPI0025AC06DE|nr:fasciclin-like arabinogalactan protein 9 [Salvia miltiorrhiza]